MDLQFKTFSELEVPGNDAGLLNKAGQSFISGEHRNHRVRNTIIEAMQIVPFCKTIIGFPNLKDKHLEFHRVLLVVLDPCSISPRCLIISSSPWEARNCSL